VHLNAGWTELNTALKTLRLHWEEVQPAWKDPVGRAFEEQHWLALEQQVVATLRAMDRLRPLLARIQQECS
jgi:hypothetical protein